MPSSDLYLRFIHSIDSCSLTTKHTYPSFFAKLKQAISFQEITEVIFDMALDIYLGDSSDTYLTSFYDEDAPFASFAKLVLEHPDHLHHFLSLHQSRDDVITYYIIWFEIFYSLHKFLFEFSDQINIILAHPYAGCFFFTYAPNYINNQYYNFMYNKSEEEIDRVYVQLLTTYIDHWQHSPAILSSPEDYNQTKRFRASSHATLKEKIDELLDGFLYRSFLPDELPMTKAYLRNLHLYS